MSQKGEPGFSKKEIVRVEAFDEGAAKWEAIQQTIKRFGTGEQFPGLDVVVRLVSEGKRGFLGAGRKPNLYEVELTAKRQFPPPAQQPVQSAQPQEPLEYLRDLIVGKVAEGFYSSSEILEMATEAAADEYPELDFEAQIAQIAEAALIQHRQEEAEWQGLTDCDRLDLAFTDLEHQGIVARQNFACCQNCGHAEIGDEIRQAQQEREVRGYTFYHMQDTEAAAAGQGLYLAYGSIADSPDEAVQVGHSILDALRRAGLKPEWDGDLNRRILVPVDWKKRRHTTVA